MDVGMLHTHTTMVFLYLIILGIRVILFAMGNTGALESFSKRTRMIGIVASILLLATGIFLMVRSPLGLEPFIFAKMGLMVASIPVGIIGFKRKKLPLAVLSFLLLCGSLVLAYTKPAFLRSSADVKGISADAGNDKAVLEAGKVVYESACKLCHGPSGDAGFQGAKNLQQSTMADAEIKTLIRQGKGMMPANTDLSDKQVEDVIAYVKYLRK